MKMKYRRVKYSDKASSIPENLRGFGNLTGLMSDLGLKIYVQLLIWFILIVLSSVSEGEARDTYALIKSKSTSQTEETATGFFMEFTDTSECPLALNKVNPHAVAEFGTEFTDARLCILDVDGKIDAEKIRQFLKRKNRLLLSV